MNRSSTKTIGESIRSYIAENGLGEGIQRMRIFDAWDLLSAGGVEVKRYTSSKFYKDRVLTCKITSSVARAQLRPYLESLRKQLNSLLQADLVDSIKLT